ncbi:adenylate/guanylate cyclase domain-containing protein [Planococcus sp. CPCC 101016]|uniref:adenylate/guanylate cyclase domain-containing protein n=1 Tax=Planococcus sp. CPCC 101016 TaxID=2599617 RepID=UPI0011B3AF02|nr:adenylate/guanylate cyclase domain-containing protein [Planococcus sp. CPCC 101016]TWT08204.1 adenylate/guanylate cyclase domain-containing protein [Planococcus sp. CPCC 101016]
MKNNYKFYDFEESEKRLTEILDSSSSFEELDHIPSSDKLTFINGYYINCTSVFVDLRDSSKLPDIHQNRVLAKIYRAYISEIVAIMNGYSECREIDIVGDCVSGIFETPKTSNIRNILGMIATINSLIQVLNYKLEKRSYSSIKVGIGVSYGRVLMIKAGYKGSSINEVVYMGEAVNQASKMCGLANKVVNSPIVLTPTFHLNLTEEQQGWFTRGWNTLGRFSDPEYYHGTVINTLIEEWLNKK